MFVPIVFTTFEVNSVITVAKGQVTTFEGRSASFTFCEVFEIKISPIFVWDMSVVFDITSERYVCFSLSPFINPTPILGRSEWTGTHAVNARRI